MIEQRMIEQRPKGVIGQWYTLTSDFNGIGETEDRKAGYTWQCEAVDHYDEPTIDGLALTSYETYRLATPEDIARAKGERRELTPYQQSVADHMKDAPQALRDYVCGRLKDSSWWEEGRNPIYYCGFGWITSKEGAGFWYSVYYMDWENAMATDFWQPYRQNETKDKYIESPIVTVDDFYNDEKTLIIHNYINLKGKMVLNKQEASLLLLELYKFVKS